MLKRETAKESQRIIWWACTSVMSSFIPAAFLILSFLRFFSDNRQPITESWCYAVKKSGTAQSNTERNMRMVPPSIIIAQRVSSGFGVESDFHKPRLKSTYPTTIPTIQPGAIYHLSFQFLVLIFGLIFWALPKNNINLKLII